MRQEIEQAIVAGIRKVKKVEAPLDAGTRFDTLDVTSLEMVTIVFEIEDAFGLNLVDAGLDSFETVGEACDVVLQMIESEGVEQAVAVGS